MNAVFSKELTNLFSEIVRENKTEPEWAEIEADDWFQRDNIIGGFDATENEFTFSIFVDEIEYWLQISLKDIAKYMSGEIIFADIRKAE